MKAEGAVAATLRSYDWFKGPLDRIPADQILSKVRLFGADQGSEQFGLGAFLVRESTAKSDAFCLSFKLPLLILFESPT